MSGRQRRQLHYHQPQRPRARAPPPRPVAWTAGQAGADQRTPDLSSVVQEIINRPGWAGGNALALIVTGSGRRTAVAHNGSATTARSYTSNTNRRRVRARPRGSFGTGRGRRNPSSSA